MSHRDGGNGGRGGVVPPTQQLSNMSMRDRIAVDGSPLKLGDKVAPPRPNPMSSNQLDPTKSKKVLDDVQASDMTHAEFPLRAALTKPNTAVYTNHFVVKVDDTKSLYEYNIVGLPNNISKRTAKQLVQALFDRTPFLNANRNGFATDYARKVISWIRFPNEILRSVQSAEWTAPIAIGLQYAGVVDTNLLRRYAEGKVEPTKDVEAQIKLVNAALNMVLSTAIGSGTFSLKANKFFITGGHTNLSKSLCAIRGYYYTIRPGMGQILLNLSSCTSAFYQPMFVSEFLNDTTTFRNQQERLAQLRGLRVHLTYEPLHNGNEPRSQAAMIQARIKTIAGTGEPATKQKFQLKSQNGSPDTEVTVAAYFEKTYNTKLQNQNMETINCGTDIQPAWYPAEKLFILPYQLFKRTVPDTLTADMLDVACHFPDMTRALIEHEGLGKLGIVPGTSSTQLSQCPFIQIDSRMLKIPATILQYPKPKYANGTVDMRLPNWNLMNRKFLKTYSTSPLKAFILAVPRSNGTSVLKDESFLKQTFAGFQKMIQTTYATATVKLVGSTISPQFGQDMKAAEDIMQQAKNRGANFIMLFLEKKGGLPYACFKDLADRKYGLRSVCVTYDAKRGFTPQYWANIAMKINLKAGGMNHTVDGVQLIMKDTLVLGADVTHPGQGSLLGTPSIAAIVGSVDQYAGKFLGSMRLQPRDTACEIIQDLRSMVLERIKAWFVNNGKKLPKNILFYRDGVSDSQYSQVKDQELPQIRCAFEEAAKKAGLPTVPQMKLTAFVVGKRHHVKLFPTTGDAMPKNGNCKPGTVVDSMITSPYYRDFYLQSHNSIKGTAKSAHYFPLVNEMGLTEQQMQDFTHKLCYTYVRATMGVSYAPPAYYADRLCERGRCYLRDFLNPPPNSPFTHEPKKLKNKQTNDARAAREAKYKAQRIRQIYNGDVNMAKSKEELQQEVKDEASIEDMVKALVFGEAKRVFYGGETEKNPWHDNLANIMFWM